MTMTDAPKKERTRETHDRGLTHTERAALEDSKRRHHRALEELREALTPPLSGSILQFLSIHAGTSQLRA